MSNSRNSELCVDQTLRKWSVCEAASKNAKTTTEKWYQLSMRNKCVERGVCLRQVFQLRSYAPYVRKEKYEFDFLVVGFVECIAGTMSPKTNLLNKC